MTFYCYIRVSDWKTLYSQFQMSNFSKNDVCNNEFVSIIFTLPVLFWSVKPSRIEFRVFETFSGFYQTNLLAVLQNLFC